jgi:hypothetical protein
LSVQHSTPLVEALRKRRTMSRNKMMHCEFELDDFVEHYAWCAQQEQVLDVERAKIARNLQINKSRSKREKGQDKQEARAAQKARLDKQRADFNANVSALKEDREWLESTNAWKNILKRLNELTVRTRSGECYTREELEDDQAEWGDFANFVKAFKAEESGSSSGATVRSDPE